MIDRDASTLKPQSETAAGPRVPTEEMRTEALRNAGRFEVLAEIGRGGMGIVYEARQLMPEREVALKVIRGDLVSPDLWRRFEYEAQLLGRLQHPGIAGIYEFGVIDLGQGVQPYFAMEIVRGRILSESAQQARLSVEERIHLLVKLCAAVEHAHQKGIIHRDLKPENVLVEDSGQPKILDFGVARANEADRQATMHTGRGQLVGTIAYMSPEQVSGDPDALDTRSDVYALGVIGYEFLTGKFPYDVLGRSILDAIAVVREAEPVPLGRHGHRFQGDLETIFAKALEKDRSQRYQSAAALAGDLERYLADRPILARPPSTIYQLKKFARRHRAIVGGSAAVVLALVLGIVTTTYQAVVAGRERAEAVQARSLMERALRQTVAARDQAAESQKRAEGEAKTANSAFGFLSEIFAVSSPFSTVEGFEKRDRPLGDDVTARQLLDRAAERIDTEIQDDPLLRVRLLRVIGRVYSDLAHFDRARELLGEAVQVAETIQGENPKELPLSMMALARAEAGASRPGSVELMRKTLELTARVEGPDSPTAIRCKLDLAVNLIYHGEFDESERILREILPRFGEPALEKDKGRITAMESLARILEDTDRKQEAEEYLKEGERLSSEIMDENHPFRYSASFSYTSFLIRQRRFDEAEPSARLCLAVARKRSPKGHPDLNAALGNLALTLYSRATGLIYKGKFDEGSSLLNEAIALQREVQGSDHPDVARSLHTFALLLRTAKKYREAEVMLAEAVHIAESKLQPNDPERVKYKKDLAALEVRIREIENSAAAKDK